MFLYNIVLATLVLTCYSFIPNFKHTTSVRASLCQMNPKELTDSPNVEKPEEIRALPEYAGSEEVKTLNLGDTLKLDDMGPIIINTDGSTRRIANWDTLSEQEKESSRRLIAARNKRRIEALKAKETEEQETQKTESSGIEDTLS